MAAIAAIRASVDAQANGMLGVGLLPSMLEINETLDKGEYADEDHQADKH